MTEITWKECKNKVLRMLLVQLSAYALLTRPRPSPCPAPTPPSPGSSPA